MSVPDNKIREAVDKIFKQFDLNRDNILNLREVISLMNMSLRYLGRKGNATFQDAKQYIQFIDTNRDEKVSKEELFKHLKKILNRYA